MNALLVARLSQRTALEAMTTGRRYGGVEARDAGIVDACADSEDAVYAAAVEIATPLAANAGKTLGDIKALMYEAVAEGLRTSSTVRV
jgi:enoyl-CoA hydratase/carnithine racemase